MKHNRAVVGLDLAGVEHRPTGFCLLNARLTARTKLLYSDWEIVAETRQVGPSIVCVDAPLWLPRGRCCLKDHCKCRGRGHFRECDRVLLRLGIKFFPLTLGPMRVLTLRGIRLREELQSHGLRVIEGYPGAIQDILHLPRKREGKERLKQALLRRGVGGDVRKPDVTHHELDAVTLGMVALMHLAGRTIQVGDPEEALMVLPKPSGN